MMARDAPIKESFPSFLVCTNKSMDSKGHGTSPVSSFLFFCFLFLKKKTPYVLCCSHGVILLHAEDAVFSVIVCLLVWSKRVYDSAA